MQNVVRGVGLSGLATLIIACAMAAPAAAVQVPPPQVPHVRVAPPKITPPKITAPKSHVHAPTQPTLKGNALHPPKGLQQKNISNAPTGGGTTPGGGVKVLQGTPASPQTSPSGGTTTGGEPIGVNKQIDQPSLQGGGNATGGGVKVLQGTPASPQTNPSGGNTTTRGEAIGVTKEVNQPSPTGGGTTTGGEVNKQVGQPAPAGGTPTGGEVNKQVGQPAPTGGDSKTGGGVKVETGEVNQPLPPSGGTTTGGAEVVDVKTLLNMLQEAPPLPGGSASPQVPVTLETLRDLLQQSKADQASPAGGGANHARRIDPAQIQSVIDMVEQNQAANKAILEQSITSALKPHPMKLYYKLPTTGPGAFNICIYLNDCQTTTSCGEDSDGAVYCIYVTKCTEVPHCLFN